jgi:hypothetical protein
MGSSDVVEVVVVAAVVGGWRGECLNSVMENGFLDGFASLVRNGHGSRR